MPLGEVSFSVASGGLGRRVTGVDGIAALVFTAAAPGAYSGKFKAYYSLADVEADGIEEGDATYGEAWYQIREFFRLAPGRKLWVGFDAGFPGAFAANLFAETGGEVRLVGGYFSDFAQLNTIWQAGATALAGLFAPVNIIAGYKGDALTLGTVADQGASTNKNVSVLLAGDGGAKGAALATALGVDYVPAVGAVLGAAASAKVHESIAWPEKFNLSDGTELDVIRLADGNDNPTDSTIGALHDKRYLVFRKFVQLAGTYLNDSHTAIAATNDLAYIESNRTIDKAIREIRATLLPKLNSPLLVNADTGALAPATVTYFEALTAKPLIVMQNAGELSGYGVYIDPDQDVLSSGVLNIQVKLVPVGVARSITVQIGFSVTATF